MHEISLCQAIIDTANKQLKNLPNAVVVSLHLSIGALVPVDLDSLLFCFPLVAKESQFSQAKLVITTVAANSFCKNCLKYFAIQQRGSSCPNCEGYHYQVLNGEEFLLKSIEIQ